MSGQDRKSGADRRGFLKLAGLGALTGTSLLAGGGTEAQAKKADGDNSLYTESEHVKTYYELAGF